MRERVEPRRKISASTAALRLPKIEKQRARDTRGAENRRERNSSKPAPAITLPKKEDTIPSDKPDQEISAQAYCVYREDMSAVVGTSLPIQNTEPARKGKLPASPSS